MNCDCVCVYELFASAGALEENSRLILADARDELTRASLLHLLARRTPSAREEGARAGRDWLRLTSLLRLLLRQPTLPPEQRPRLALQLTEASACARVTKALVCNERASTQRDRRCQTSP